MKILDLIRIKQWYKNLLVFLAILFSGNLFNLSYLNTCLIGFFALSFMSSTNYIINDIKDRKKDRLHPEKQLRPIASGNISLNKAIIIAIILFSISLIFSSVLGFKFIYLILLLFVLTQVYSFFLKNIIFADILTIAILFVIRSISGAYLINVEISPWLILCPFFLSIFLSVGKRHAEILLLKENSYKTRSVLKDYTKDITNSLMTISTTLLIISYALYSFQSIQKNLILTMPLALFIIFRFHYLIISGSIIARHPEYVIKDKPMIISIILWIISIITIIY